MISGRWTSGNKQKIIGSRISKITAHPVFLTTDTQNSEKGNLCVILREKYRHWYWKQRKIGPKKSDKGNLRFMIREICR